MLIGEFFLLLFFLLSHTLLSFSLYCFCVVVALVCYSCLSVMGLLVDWLRGDIKLVVDKVCNGDLSLKCWSFISNKNAEFSHMQHFGCKLGLAYAKACTYWAEHGRMQLMMNDDAKYPRNMRPIALSFVFYLLYLLRSSLFLSWLFSLVGYVLSASVLRSSSLHCLLQYNQF